MSAKTPNWNAKGDDRTARNAMAIGASNVRGLGLTTPDAQCWLSLLRDTYSRWPSRGRGFKMYPITSEFTPTGSHTKIDSGIDDRSPYGIQARLSGSGNSYRFTKTAGDVIRGVVYCDATGSGSWSISRDGAAYASAGAATAHDHALKLATLTDPTSTLDIRGADAGGTTAQCDLLGVLLENTTGLVRWDNVAIDSHRLSGVQASTLDSFARTGSSGDPLAIIDFLDPDACFLSDYINDVSVNPSIDAGWVTTLGTALDAIIDRLQAINCDPIVIIYPETDPSVSANATLANQALARQKAADVAAAQGVETLDVYSLFGGSYTAGIAAGYFQADKLHWSATGHDVVAQAAWRLLAQTGAAFLRA